MSKKQELPASGGSYTRKSDGKLTKAAAPSTRKTEKEPKNGA